MTEGSTATKGRKRIDEHNLTCYPQNIMNFSVHLNEELVRRLNEAAKESGKTRNALIREAVAEWLGHRRPGRWPAEVMNFCGIRGLKRFEQTRKNLKPPRPPFDAVSA